MSSSPRTISMMIEQLVPCIVYRIRISDEIFFHIPVFDAKSYQNDNTTHAAARHTLTTAGTTTALSVGHAAGGTTLSNVGSGLSHGAQAINSGIHTTTELFAKRLHTVAHGLTSTLTTCGADRILRTARKNRVKAPVRANPITNLYLLQLFRMITSWPSKNEMMTTMMITICWPVVTRTAR